MNLIHYLLEANLYLAAFYLLYVLLLRSETLYQLNRAYILTTSLIAFIIPLLQLGVLKPEIKHTAHVGMVSLDTEAVSVTVLPAVAQVPRWAAVDYALAIYGIVTLALLVLLAFKIAKLIALSKKGTAKRRDGFVLVEVPGENVAFSFFCYLFVNTELSASQTILHHEEVHIRQKHSWDVIYFELLKIFNWFNPAIYLLQKSLKEVHEFIADQQVAAAGSGAGEYADFLISNAYGLNNNQLTNSFFNKNLLKRRIIMLYQKKSGRAARLKYLLTLPLFGGLLCASTLAFTTKNYGVVDLAPKSVANKVEKPVAANKSVPAFPGGTQALYKFLNDNIDRSKVEDGNIVNHLFMMFKVEKDGSVSNLEIKHSPKGEFKPETVTEITRVLINGPKWIPATNNGEAVSAKSFIVFEFKDGTGPANMDAKQPVATKDNNGFVLNAVEKKPLFPGGEAAFGKFLAKNIKYPKEALAKNITGRTFVSFIVETDGSLSEVKAVREPGYGLGAEAVRVMKLSPKWSPGVQNGKKVRVMYTVPVNFSIAGDDKKSAQPNPTKKTYGDNGIINASFPGGEEAFGKFLVSHVKYPAAAKTSNVQGRVFVQFIVGADGSLSDFKVVRDPGSGLGDEALRVMKLSPNWVPATKDGNNVRTEFTVPINFSMVDDDAPKDTKAFYKYIRDHVRYPAAAKERNIQGRSFISFTVDANKNIQGIEVLRSPDKLLSDEITRVIAGFKTFSDGKPNVTYTIPVNYSINNGDDKVAPPVNAQPVANNSALKNAEKIMLNEVVIVGFRKVN